LKRFYSEVAVEEGEGGFALLLDGRAVRTPERARLLLPNAALAEAVADEWRAQGETIDPAAMVMTGLSNAVIDRVVPDPAGFAEGLARYAASDALCYRAEHPADLVARQAAEWDPPLRAVEERFDVRFRLSAGVHFVEQPSDTLKRMRKAYEALSPWTLAPLQPVVTITGSAVLGLVLLHGMAEREAVFRSGMLEELYQVEKWGDDPIALAARESRRVSFDAAADFLRLVA